MKTLVLNEKKLGTILPILGFVLLTSLVLTTGPASATEFEFGTQFGLSHLQPDNDDAFLTSLTYIRLPSSPPLEILSPSPTSLYATWFPNKQFAIGPEFGLGRTSFSASLWGSSGTESLTILHLGGRASYFLISHAVSSPYILGRVSLNILSDDDDNETLTSFGGGFGYQWRIGPSFVLRAEGQYQRLLISDNEDGANEFSLTIGIGTRFGNSNNPQ